jgi:hypothetical protein
MPRSHVRRVVVSDRSAGYPSFSLTVRAAVALSGRRAAAAVARAAAIRARHVGATDLLLLIS